MYTILVESSESTYTTGEYHALSAACNAMASMIGINKDSFSNYLVERNGSVVAIQKGDAILSVIKRSIEYRYRIYIYRTEDDLRSFKLEGTKDDIINWLTKWYRLMLDSLDDPEMVVSDDTLNTFINDKYTSKFKDDAIKQVLYEYQCPSGDEYHLGHIPQFLVYRV